MNKKQLNYKVKQQDTESLMNYHLRELIGYKRQTLQLHAHVLKSLLKFLQQPKSNLLCFHEDNLINWMIINSKGKRAGYCASQFQILDRYVERLRIAGVLPDNPLRKFKPWCKTPSWKTVAKVLQSETRQCALQKLRLPITKRGPLHAHIEKYIALQQSLGKEYRNVSSTLNDLDRSLEQCGVTKVNMIKPDHIRNWLKQMKCRKDVIMARAHAAKRFMHYLMGTGIISSNPVTDIIHEYGRVPFTKFRPFIFTKDQIVRILEKTKQLKPNHKFKLRPQASHMMLLLAYALGLRNGEVRRIRFSDVDMDQGTIRIEGTKFHKSRLLPFGPCVQKCLKSYISARRKIFLPIMPDDPLFITNRRKPIAEATLCGILKAVTTDMVCENSYSPRVHDLRHTFAVHRLLRWYREGINVQSKLPLLSAFMGHTEISSTEVYLTITMDLLSEANDRFYNLFGKELKI